MRVEITNSQRMALMTILSDRMRDQEAVQSFIDCAQDVETTTPQLLKLFMDAAENTLIDIAKNARLPDDGISVLALSDLDGWTVATLEDDEWVEDSTGDRITVLKWMHLPAEEE